MRNRSGVFSFFFFLFLLIDEQREGWGEMIHRSWINLITHTQQAIVREERLSTAFFLSSFSERPRYINLFRTFWKERKTFFFFRTKRQNKLPSSLSHDDESRSLQKTDWNFVFVFFVVVFVCRTMDRSVEIINLHDAIHHFRWRSLRNGYDIIHHHI